MATATLNDMSVLASDLTFQARVGQSLFIYCWSTVPGETVGSSNLAQHIARKNFSAQILNNPTTYKPLFVNVVSANQIVANDATTNGSIVGLASSAIAAAALLCTDSDINNAIAAAFNAFIPGI